MYQGLNNGVKRLAGLGAVVQATLNNLTRTGADSTFYVGDKWALTIIGPPNTTIKMSGGKDGGTGIWNPGWVTDPSGRFTTTGQMGADQVGSWSETWIVGTDSAPAIVFVVQQPPSGTQQTQQQQTQQQQVSTNPLGGLLDLKLFGFPAWMVAGAGLVAYSMLKGRR